jgi:1H-pyrrole-2-carbonyl-[peptidyl-carrier protein] chlorinase
MTDTDVIVIGGGPAGSVTASLLAQAGHSVLLLEQDIHPRDHVGESLTPSSTPIFRQIGFHQKMEDAGFIHKPGACWTAPTSSVGKFIEIRLGEFPLEAAKQPYTYNVERDVLDSMLIRHAHELGAKVVQGVRVEKVLFEGERAVGVQAKVISGWEQELIAKIVVDASGRRCLLASQLGLKRRDQFLNQFAMYSWFKNVEPHPPGTEGVIFLHFLGLERAWSWQIPLRNGLVSVGMVVDRADFKKYGANKDEFFDSLVERNRTLSHNMRHAERVREWWMEGDYSYTIDKLVGNGWMLVGDAQRFVDPIFSTGVDVATNSALYAFQSIDAVLKGADQAQVFGEYERKLSEGTDAWYDFIRLFYKLQNLFTMFATNKRYHEQVVRVLQGNLYNPESIKRARDLITNMEETYASIMAQPSNLLKQGALWSDRVASQDGRGSDASTATTSSIELPNQVA